MSPAVRRPVVTAQRPVAFITRLGNPTGHHARHRPHRGPQNLRERDGPRDRNGLDQVPDDGGQTWVSQLEPHPVTRRRTRLPAIEAISAPYAVLQRVKSQPCIHQGARVRCTVDKTRRRSRVEHRPPGTSRREIHVVVGKTRRSAPSRKYAHCDSRSHRGASPSRR